MHSEADVVQQVEGTCSGKHGYVVAVVKVLDTGEGRIREGTGYATFQVTYQALCLRPFKNEVVQATVQTVTKASSSRECSCIALWPACQAKSNTKAYTRPYTR